MLSTTTNDPSSRPRVPTLVFCLPIQSLTFLDTGKHTRKPGQCRDTTGRFLTSLAFLPHMAFRRSPVKVYALVQCHVIHHWKFVISHRPASPDPALIQIPTQKETGTSGETIAISVAARVLRLVLHLVLRCVLFSELALAPVIRFFFQTCPQTRSPLFRSHEFIIPCRTHLGTVGLITGERVIMADALAWRSEVGPHAAFRGTRRTGELFKPLTATGRVASVRSPKGQPDSEKRRC